MQRLSHLFSHGLLPCPKNLQKQIESVSYLSQMEKSRHLQARKSCSLAWPWDQNLDSPLHIPGGPADTTTLWEEDPTSGHLLVHDLCLRWLEGYGSR